MSIAIDPDSGSLAHDLDRAHVFHSWSAQGALDPFVIAGALGSTVWDFEGNEYLDFSSQLVNMNIGHQHPKLIQAIKDQADIITMVAPPHANLARGEAAKRILSVAGTRNSGGSSSPTAVQTRTRTPSAWRAW